MHRLRKSLLASLVIASLVLAACGDDDDADAPAAAPEAEPAAAPEAEPAAAPEAEPAAAPEAEPAAAPEAEPAAEPEAAPAAEPEAVDDAEMAEGSACEVEGTLSMFSWENEQRMEPLLDGFTAEYPNVNIDFSHSPPVDQYLQRLKLLQGANDLPDVFNTTIGEPLHGFVADITELDAVQALPQNFQDTYSRDGRVIAYSPSTWLGGIFYNKTLFEEYGFEEPSTLDELMEMVHTFESDGIQAFGFDANTLWDLALFHYNGTFHPEDPGAQRGIATGERTFEETRHEQVA